MGIGICPLNGLPDGHAFPVPVPGKRPKEKIQTVYLKCKQPKKIRTQSK